MKKSDLLQRWCRLFLMFPSSMRSLCGFWEIARKIASFTTFMWTITSFPKRSLAPRLAKSPKWRSFSPQSRCGRRRRQARAEREREQEQSEERCTENSTDLHCSFVGKRKMALCFSAPLYKKSRAYVRRKRGRGLEVREGGKERVGDERRKESKNLRSCLFLFYANFN